jgi:hypothetical protein
MADPTTSRTWMLPVAIASLRPRSLACLKARHAPAPKARASAKREILDLLGHAHLQSREAMESAI